MDREVRREGTRWGTPRKRAQFGPDGPDSIIQRWPGPGGHRVELEDAVARL